MNWKLDTISFEDYGVFVSRAKGVLNLPKITIPSHNWLDSKGIDYWTDETTYREKDRIIDLYCVIEATDINDFGSKVDAFWAVVSASDFRDLSCDYITTPIEVYLKTKVTLKRHTGFSDEHQVGVFTLRLTVPGDELDIINIARYYSTSIIAAVKTKDFRIQKTLQGEFFASLSFESNTALDIRNGDFIQFEYDGNGFDRFLLDGEPQFEKKSTNKYIYKLKFNHQFNLFSHVQFLFDGEADFYYFADLETIVNLMITNHLRSGFNKFIKGSIASTVKRNHKFSDENCLQVLKRLCEEYELEFEFNHSVSTYKYSINIAEQVATDTPIILQYGKGAGQYDLQRSARLVDEYVTKLFAFGAAKNLKPDYRDGMRRLSFTGNPLSNISDYTEYREKTIYFDDIYPQRTAQVTGYYQKLLDDCTDAEKDLHPGGIYRIEDTGLFNINDYLLGGLTAKIRMKSGNLAGYEFEIESYDHDNFHIYLIPTKDPRGGMLPADDLQINTDDYYTLVDIDQPSSYIVTAETELEAAAQAYLDEHSVPKFIYRCTIDPLFVEAQSICFEVGDQVTIVDSDYGVNQKFRISALTYNHYTKVYNLSFSETAVRGNIQSLNEGLQSLERAADDTKKNTVESNRKDTETTGELRNKIFDPADDKQSVDRTIRDESIDPRMLSYDAGVPQISINNGLVECNVDGNVDRVKIGGGKLVMHNFRDETLSRWDIQKLKDDGGTYDPTREWTIDETYFNLANANGVYMYAKITMEGSDTTCIVSVSESHKEVKLEPGYLIYKLGFISDSSSPRHPEMVYGNIKTVTPAMVGQSEAVADAIGDAIADCKEYFIIENTANASETQLSSWGVVDWNDLIGVFTVVATIYNKVGYVITTLKNVLGYDYSDVAHETEDDNEIISNGTITMVLSVDTSNVLKAVLTGMPTDAKRIVFCFQRCCVKTRVIEMTGTIDTDSEVTGNLNGYLIRGISDGESDVTGIISGGGLIAGSTDGESTVTAGNESIGSLSGIINCSSSISVDLIEKCGDLYDSLIGNYKFNDTTDTIQDVVGGANLSNNGANLQETGIINECVGFDALSNDYISGNAIYDGQTYSALTLSVWVKVNTISGTHHVFQRYLSDLSAGKVSLGITQNNNKILYGITHEPDNNYKSFELDVGVGEWHNLTIGVDRINGKLHLWADGIRKSIVGGETIGTFNLFDGVFIIGRHQTADLFRLDGYIDDMKIWNRLLIDCEAEANYNDGNGIEL